MFRKRIRGCRAGGTRGGGHLEDGCERLKLGRPSEKATGSGVQRGQGLPGWSEAGGHS